MNRSHLNVDWTEFIPLVLGGIAGAAWLLLFTSDVAFADDCLQYVKNVKNFVAIPKGLLEDCMRTGSVQAIITAAIGGVGGGVIATAVNKGLKDAAKSEPRTREPPVEKKDGASPEAPPPPQTRGEVPEECKGLWDNFRSALEDAERQGGEVQARKKVYEYAFRNHQNNLAKLTIQLGMDAADLASAGASGIKGGMGIARAVAQAPEMLADLITKTAARSGSIAARLSGLLDDLAGIAGRAGRIATKVDDVGRLSAEAESRFFSIAREAGAIEGKLTDIEVVLRAARAADTAAAERKALMKSLGEAEQALEAQKSAMKRKQGLQDWADGERAAILNEDARAFAAKQQEVYDLRNKLQAMREKHAAEAKAAHARWQAKVGESRQAKIRLDGDGAKIDGVNQKRLRAESAKLKRENALKIKQEAELRLQDADAALDAFDEQQLAKYKAGRDDRIAKAKAELKAAEEQPISELKRKQREAREQLAEFDSRMNNLEPDLTKLDADAIARREQLDQTYLDAELKKLEAETALNDWNAKSGTPDAWASVPDEVKGPVITARREAKDALSELQQFDAEVRTQALSDMTPEELAENSRLTNAFNESSSQLREAETRLQKAKEGMWLPENATPEQEARFSRQQSASERERFIKAQEAAHKEMDYAQKVAYDAEVERVKADADFEASGGAAELEARRAEYDRLVQEADDLRAFHEDLQSGSFEDDFSEITGRKEKLETELSNWKEPDWEQVAAQRNPEQHSAWKSEVGGSNPRADAEATLKPYQDRVTELQAQEAAIEKRVNEARDQIPGGRNTESVEAEKQSLTSELNAKKEELTRAREAEIAKKKELADEQANLRKAYEERSAKEAEIERMKKAKQDNDADLAALEAQRNKPPKDIFDSISDASRSVRKGFDAILDASIPPPIRWNYQGLKWVGGQFGELFRRAFGGQSPEEVAAIIKQGDAEVTATSQALADAEVKYEMGMWGVRNRKSDLDACVARNNVRNKE